MKSLLFRQFTHFAVLKACGVELLKSLLAKAVAAAGDKTSIKLPVLGTGKTAESDYYRDLLALFREPERLPDGLCEVLYLC